MLEQPPTQTIYPIRAALRTAVAGLLGLLTVWLVKEMPGIGTILQDFGPSFVDPITNGIILILTGVWTWIMAHPKINPILTAIGLGARPKSIEAS